MSNACPDRPSASRKPRRGDVVVAAPHGQGGVSGTITGVAARAVTLKTASGCIQTVEVERLTWKAKARQWVCWPGDIIRHMRGVLQADAAHARARFGVTPQVGDHVRVDGQTGWISRFYAKPVKADPGVGAIFHTFAGYEITLNGGSVRVEDTRMSFCTEERVWRASA